MKTLKDDRKTRYTKTVLRDSLMELMKRKPITKITIKELCETADINRTTFYAHYLDQYDLLRKIEDEMISWVKEVITDLQGKSDKHEILPYIEKILEYIVQNNNHIGVLMSEQGDLEFQNRLFATVYEYKTVIPFNLDGDDEENEELYNVFIVNGSVGLIRHWIKNGMNIPPKKLAKLIYDLPILKHI